TLGLIDAAANFDPSRGLAFTTFATPRIRGAMLDELRRLDHVPRSVRRRARALNAASEALCSELGSAPDQAQVAERLGIDVATLSRWRADTEAAQAVPLTHLECDGVAEALCAPNADVDDVLTREQELHALKAAIMTLGSRERAVLALYFYEELRLHQIAEVLGVSESRVSQIRTQALGRLRTHMARFRDRAPITPRCRPRDVAPLSA
ncbi:MAG TPA: sigma-70 family RNA polymerase sigma factor, partial [Gemmatimonadaceae bacterium]|nr:sigma-70 family RNA polymerase sigma factor [Gemmatimonadaceae bacterium]